MYGSDSDPYRMYELYRDAYSIKQNGGSLDSIWSRFQEIWFEMDCKKPNPMTCSECIKKFDEYVQTERLFQFLMAIDDRFESVRREVLLTDPLPSLTTAYAMVRRETEIQMRKVREDKSKLVCSHCGGRRHDKDSCFYLIGFPEWWEGAKKMKPSTASGIRQPQSSSIRQPMALSAWSTVRSTEAKPTYGGFFREIGTAVSNITEEEEYSDEDDLWFWH